MPSQNLVQKLKRGKCTYHFVEIMACPSGEETIHFVLAYDSIMIQHPVVCVHFHSGHSTIQNFPLKKKVHTTTIWSFTRYTDLAWFTSLLQFLNWKIQNCGMTFWFGLYRMDIGIYWNRKNFWYCLLFVSQNLVLLFSCVLIMS